MVEKEKYKRRGRRRREEAKKRKKEEEKFKNLRYRYQLRNCMEYVYENIL